MTAKDRAVTSDTPDALPDLEGTWRLDPSRSSVHFRTKAMWLLTVKGTFAAREGIGEVDGGRVTGRLVVSAASIDTSNARRDKHLRGRDFLDVEQYPRIVFDVNDADLGVRDHGSIDGELAIHGVTRPLTLDCSIRTEGTATVVLEARAVVNRADFGVTWSKMGAGLSNSLVIKATFVRSG